MRGLTLIPATLMPEGFRSAGLEVVVGVLSAIVSLRLQGFVQKMQEQSH